MNTKLLILLLASCVISLEAHSLVNPYYTIAGDNNAFGSNLYDVVLEKHADKNVVISTLSVFLVLLMLERGACGTTKQIIQNTLFNAGHFQYEDNVMNTFIKAILEKLKDIRIANKIYVNNQFNIKPAYQHIIQDEFNAVPSYFDALKPYAAAREINKYVENFTNYTIQNIIDEHDIDQKTMIILVNAIYFKETWKTKFNLYSTMDRDFYIRTNCPIRVPTMKVKGEFLNGFIAALNAKFIRIPYKKPDIEMLIIIPNDIDGLFNMERQLRYHKIDNLLGNSAYDELELELPKFKIERSFRLNEFLIQVGLPNLFDRPDLSAIAKGPLVISQVKHKAFIDVDEKGTEASAATITIGAGMSAGSAESPKTFKVNQPYHYNIRIAGTTVFQGHVLNPALYN